jgi:hypothetical protein
MQTSSTFPDTFPSPGTEDHVGAVSEGGMSFFRRWSASCWDTIAIRA